MPADRLAKIKTVKLPNKTFFNEFVVELPVSAAETVKKLASQGIIAGLPLEGGKLLVAATEMTSEADMEALALALEKICACVAQKEVA